MVPLPGNMIWKIIGREAVRPQQAGTEASGLSGLPIHRHQFRRLEVRRLDASCIGVVIADDLLGHERVAGLGERPEEDLRCPLVLEDRLLEQAGDLTIGRDPGGDKNGLLAGTTLGFVTDSYSYNDFGELEYYQALHDGTDNLYEVFYERDLLGRVIRRAERVLTGSVEVREYDYHVRGWLQTVWIGTGSCTLSTCDCTVVTCAIGESYTYDANGNRETASGSLHVVIP